MNIHNQQDWKTGAAVSSSANLNVSCGTEQTLSVHVTATSSLAGVFEGTFDDVNDSTVTVDWFPLPAIYTNTSGVTENIPGATITPTDDDVMHCALQGSRFVRFRRTAGSGTVSWTLSDQNIADIRSAAGDSPSVTTTPPAITAYRFIPDGTDELLISASARKYWGARVITKDATPVYVKLYDKATAASESDTPFDSVTAPANSTAALMAGNNGLVPGGYVALTNGLSVRAVVGLADNDDTALTTAENIVTVYWSA